MSEKRKVLSCWINDKNRGKLVEKFGKLPDSKTVLSILLNEPIVTKNIDQSKREFLFQLKQIGNNLNQISRSLNQNNNQNFDKEIEFLLQEIKQKIKEIN